MANKAQDGHVLSENGIWLIGREEAGERRGGRVFRNRCRRGLLGCLLRFHFHSIVLLLFQYLHDGISLLLLEFGLSLFGLVVNLFLRSGFGFGGGISPS